MPDCGKTEVFFKEYNRMCSTISCSDCNIGSNYSFTNISDCIRVVSHDPQEAIEIVQKWSDENPLKTRLSMFLEMFPNAEIADDGMPYIYPCKLDANYEFSEDCKEFLGGFRCGMCKKEYWLAEVE